MALCAASVFVSCNAVFGCSPRPFIDVALLLRLPRPALVVEGRPWKNAAAKVGKLIVAQPVFRGGRCTRSALRTCRSGGKRSDGGVRAT